MSEVSPADFWILLLAAFLIGVSVTVFIMDPRRHQANHWTARAPRPPILDQAPDVEADIPELKIKAQDGDEITYRDGHPFIVRRRDSSPAHWRRLEDL